MTRVPFLTNDRLPTPSFVSGFVDPGDNVASAAVPSSLFSVLHMRVSSASAAGEDAHMSFFVEDGVGVGTYTEQLRTGVSGVIATVFGAVTLVVPAGRKWKHVKTNTSSLVAGNQIDF